MCVLSRVLYGDIQKLSLDLERKSNSRNWFSSLLSTPLQQASKKTSENLKAPSVTMLFPFEGNLHEFVAGPFGAAVLDVLLPPYEDHRECTFYELKEENS